MQNKNKPNFPFVAVVGQNALKTALLLATIDIKLGGVLVSGPRGTAKSTLVRGLVDLLDDSLIESQFITLPLGASEEQLVGSLDLSKVLGEQKVEFQPGLLAKAHSGILYIDEVNLLPDHLVDLLLDASALGINYIERDGISHSHPSEFILVGTMNPDEGELRPQLIDRFGLAVQLDNNFDATLRVSAVQKRLAFDDNPSEFCNNFKAEQDQLRLQIKTAKAHLPQVNCPLAIQTYIAEQCIAAQVDGLRGDIIWQRAAKAYAALNQETEVTQSHCDAVADFVLSHRRNCNPNQPPPNSDSNNNNDDNSNSDSSSSNSNNSSSNNSNPNNNNETTGSWGAMEPERQTTSERRILESKNNLLHSPQKANAYRINQQYLQTLSGQQNSTGQQTTNKTQQSLGKSNQINWFKTLTHKQNVKNKQLETLLFKSRRKQKQTVSLILLDTSASTLPSKALAQAKGLVAGVMHQAYIAREKVAVLGFGNQKVEWLFRLQKALKDSEAQLNRWSGAGGTPLRQALIQGHHFIQQQLKRSPGTDIKTILITDGRSQDNWNDINWSTPLWVVDTEKSSIKLGRCRAIAKSLKGQYHSIDDAVMAVQ